jgi:hypothetical protein
MLSSPACRSSSRTSPSPAAHPRLLELLQGNELGTFEAEPTIDLYKSLIASKPSLKPALEALVSAKLSPATDADAVSDYDDGPAFASKDVYLLGIHILSQRTEHADLLLLVQSLLAACPHAAWARTAAQTALLRVAKQSPEGREAALPLVLAALKTARTCVNDAVDRAFPHIEEAINELMEDIEMDESTQGMKMALKKLGRTRMDIGEVQQDEGRDLAKEMESWVAVARS